jgi:hypothetical protein
MYDLRTELTQSKVNGCLAMDDQKTEEEWYKHAQEEAQ